MHHLLLQNFLSICRFCFTHNMFQMLGWQRRLICISWLWWRGAQVNIAVVTPCGLVVLFCCYFFIEQVMYQLWHSGLVQMFKITFWPIANTPVVYFICNVFYLLFRTRKQSFIVLKLIKQPTYNFISYKKDSFENWPFTSLSGLIYNDLLDLSKIIQPSTKHVHYWAKGHCHRSMLFYFLIGQRQCLEGTLVHAFFWHPCFAFFSIARLHAAVVLNPRYPEVAPLFSLSLSWKGERSGHTDDNLRVRTFSYTKSLVHNFVVVVAVMGLLGSNNLLLFLTSFVRLWRARWMCLKMSFRAHVQDTSSWPIRFHACASAWTCIWRPKDKMMESRGRESFPEKKCVCAPWGNKYCSHYVKSALHISEETLYHWLLSIFFVIFFFFRGPNRLKPFKYNHPQGFFSHR